MKYTLDDLTARYKYEPKLRDVFVEGKFDKVVIDAVLALNGPTKYTRVLPIDAVSINAVVTAGMDDEIGNRRKLEYLSSNLPREVHDSVRLVIDADHDHMNAAPSPPTPLLRTDYANMFMYFWLNGAFRSFLTSGLLVNVNTDQLFADLSNIALRITCLRYASVALGLHLSKLSFKSALSVTAGRVSLDYIAHMNAYYRQNARSRPKSAPSVNDFDVCANSAYTRATSNGDDRYYINDHVLEDCVLWYIDNCGLVPCACSADTFHCCIRTAAGINGLASQHMFMALIAWSR